MARDGHSGRSTAARGRLLWSSRGGPPLRLLRSRFPHADIHVTVGPTEGIVAGRLERRFDLGLISLPWPQKDLTIVPLFEEELLVLRPARRAGASSSVRIVQPAELAEAPFLLYPKSSNMRSMIDRFF